MKLSFSKQIARSLTGLALGLCLPLVGGHALAQNTNVTLWTFDNVTGANDLADSWAAFNWGGSTISLDLTQDANNNPNTGAVYVVADPHASQNAVIVTCFYPNNKPETGGHIYWSANPEDLTTFTNIEFDFKWDNANSARTISDFNFPPSPYGDSGIKLQAIQSNNSWVLITNVIFPSTVTNGWVHMRVPISASIPGINATIGLAMQKYFNDASFGKSAFWIENFKLDALQVPLPPPTVKPFVKASPGLNAVATSTGQYDRHIGRLINNSGKSWVGQATSGNPVTYTFTVNSFPTDPATYNSTETLLFLVPNPTQNGAGSPDWNELSAVQATIQQQSATKSTFSFQYKVNEQNNNAMYNGGVQTISSSAGTNVVSYTNAPGTQPGGPVSVVVSPGVTNTSAESGNLGSVSYAGSPVGTWTIKFTSDSNFALIAPDGTTTNLVFPSYNTPTFAESTGFNVDLGMQPNNSAAFGKAVIYSSFSISNTVSPFADNFLTNSTLDTVNVWDVSMSSANSLSIVPATAAYSLTWTLPANNFSLETGSNLKQMGSWTSPTLYPVVNGSGTASQLVDKSELPSGNVVFFNMVKRTFTQLQVLLPGETNAPGTVTGKTGTPTASVSSVTTVIVNACDASWHIIQGATDTVHLTSTDGSALLPNDQALVSGTTTFSGGNGVLFGSQGAQTITATDTTDGTKTANTSSSVNVGP